MGTGLSSSSTTISLGGDLFHYKCRGALKVDYKNYLSYFKFYQRMSDFLLIELLVNKKLFLRLMVSNSYFVQNLIKTINALVVRMVGSENH